MSIAKVEPFHVEWSPANRSAWVRIRDDSGQYGIGEISPMQNGNASLELVKSSLARMLIGADPMDCAVLQARMFHDCIKTGPGGALAGALAGLDIALWDLKGKLLHRPIYKLLGGAWRTKLPFYASVGGNAQRSVDEVCRAVEKWLAHKPVLVKIRFDPDKTVRDADIRCDIAKAKAVRKLVGDDFALAFDGNNGYSVQGAIRVGRALEDLGYTWFEEPVQSYHHKTFAKVASSLDIAIAAGEQEYTLQGVQGLIDAGVAIVQPDIVKMGGFTGLQQSAALAHAYGVDLLPHQTQPSIGHTANVQFCATLLHGHYPCEVNALATGQNVVFRTPVQIVDGLCVLSDRPGLGLELDEEELSKRIRVW